MKLKLNLFALVFVLGFAVVDPHPSPGRETDLTNRRSKRAIIGGDLAKLWNVYEEEGNYIIPYVIKMETNPSLYGNISELVETAIEEYHRYTCIRFRPRTTEEQFITIRMYNTVDKYCGYTYPGYHENDDWVHINLNCGHDDHTILHELFHKVMFGHEHSRPDRDDYIRNHGPEYNANGNTVDEYKLTSGFDIFSISNYRHILKHPYDRLWARTYKLSHDDIKAINAAYSCPDTLEGRGCYKSNLPTVVNGSLYPIREIYEPMEAVRLICNNGYVHERRVGDTEKNSQGKYSGEAYSYCENGQFTPRDLTCKKVECSDDIKNCGKIRNAFNKDWRYVFEFCDLMISVHADIYGKSVCRKECGLCGDGVNFCTQLPVIYGYGHIAPSKFSGVLPYYIQGEQIEIICDEGFTSIGPTTSTCINGTFDVDYFQCVASNPPNEDEICSRAGDYLLSFRTKCSRSVTDVGPGRLVPDQSCYNNRDFVQVKCDDGFRPDNSDLSQCQDGEWIHTMLKCIPDNPDDCMDTSSECEGLKLQGFCESAERIGFMRKRCKSSCGWCGKCQGTPIFERMKSELSPIKFAYENGENITLQCFPGWKPIPGKSSSQCQNGRFNPPELYCEPIEEVCVYSRGDFGEKSVTPNMLYYPNGSKMYIQCSNNDSSEHQVTCENGHFVPENFYCPYENNRTCDVTSLQEDANEMVINILATQLKDTYEDGEEFEIPCKYDDRVIFVTCHNGVFTYQNFCIYKGIKASCSREDLPAVYGNGVIEPVKEVYTHWERISLKCASGSSSFSQPSKFQCLNGSFVNEMENLVDALICSEDGCSDEASDCQRELCDEEEVRERCRLTCRVCEGLGCSTSSIGYPAFSDYKEIYRNGEMIYLTCSKRIGLRDFELPNVNAICVNGQFDKPLPLCPEYEDYDYYNFDLLRQACQYFEDCDNRLIRYVCAETCHERLAAKELTEED